MWNILYAGLSVPQTGYIDADGIQEAAELAVRERQHNTSPQLRRTSRKAVRPLPPGIDENSFYCMIREILGEPEFQERMRIIAAKRR